MENCSSMDTNFQSCKMEKFQKSAANIVLVVSNTVLFSLQCAKRVYLSSMFL